jgi:hypothetical protein
MPNATPLGGARFPKDGRGWKSTRDRCGPYGIRRRPKPYVTYARKQPVRHKALRQTRIEGFASGRGPLKRHRAASQSFLAASASRA